MIKKESGDHGGLDELDRKLLERIKSSWKRPQLSAAENAAFDEQLSRRFRKHQASGRFRLMLTCTVSVVACALVLVVVFQHPGKNKITDKTTKGIAVAVAEKPAKDTLVENNSTSISSWMNSLTTPRTDDRMMAMLDPEYQAIAVWLSPDKEYTHGRKK